MSFLVAAVQFRPSTGDVRKNMARARQLAFEAAAKGARVVVLSELCMSGYSLDSVDNAADMSQTRDGYQTQCFSEVAFKNNCHIVFGYVESDSGKFYNSAACVGPNGQVIANSRKHNLSGRDFLWATPGNTLHPTISMKEGRLGILLGDDVLNKPRETNRFFKEGQAFYRRGSVDVVACPVNWTDKFNYPSVDWMSFVESVGTNLVVANRVGLDELEFIGGSLIVDASSKVWTNGSSFVDEAVVGGMTL
jgi:N-carbamoylputrescine amidase